MEILPKNGIFAKRNGHFEVEISRKMGNFEEKFESSLNIGNFD